MQLTEEKPTEKRYLNVEDIAQLLDFHPETVREMLRQGIIPGRKVRKEWRTSREQLDEYIRREQGKPKPEENQ